MQKIRIPGLKKERSWIFTIIDRDNRDIPCLIYTPLVRSCTAMVRSAYARQLEYYKIANLI